MTAARSLLALLTIVSFAQESLGQEFRGIIERITPGNISLPNERKSNGVYPLTLSAGGTRHATCFLVSHKFGLFLTARHAVSGRSKLYISHREQSGRYGTNASERITVESIEVRALPAPERTEDDFQLLEVVTPVGSTAESILDGIEIPAEYEVTLIDVHRSLFSANSFSRPENTSIWVSVSGDSQKETISLLDLPVQKIRWNNLQSEPQLKIIFSSMELRQRSETVFPGDSGSPVMIKFSANKSGTGKQYVIGIADGREGSSGSALPSSRVLPYLERFIPVPQISSSQIGKALEENHYSELQKYYILKNSRQAYWRLRQEPKAAEEFYNTYQQWAHKTLPTQFINPNIDEIIWGNLFLNCGDLLNVGNDSQGSPIRDFDLYLFIFERNLARNDQEGLYYRDAALRSMFELALTDELRDIDRKYVFENLHTSLLRLPDSHLCSAALKLSLADYFERTDQLPLSEAFLISTLHEYELLDNSLKRKYLSLYKSLEMSTFGIRFPAFRLSSEPQSYEFIVKTLMQDGRYQWVPKRQYTKRQIYSLSDRITAGDGFKQEINSGEGIQ